MAGATRKQPRNFRSYATMEGINAFLLPGLALYFGWPETPVEILALTLAILASSGLLIVGTLYWQAVDRRLRLKERGTLDRAVALADSAERPLLLATLAAIAVTLVAIVLHGWTGPVIAAAALSALALLEYVNYYHRQLQHFDNVADFKRLIGGGGLRTAHLRRDLDARRRRSAAERIPH